MYLYVFKDLKYDYHIDLSEEPENLLNDILKSVSNKESDTEVFISKTRYKNPNIRDISRRD